ncbi:hypothetical protein Tco_0149205 [Tanacetum coccineum]
MCVTDTAFTICVNGDRVGYFRGGRGLRQGDHELELTYVCFADDLLVMSHGDIQFVEVIKSALDEFSAYLGLIHNLSKSIVFFKSMNDTEKTAILQSLPFVVGQLLVRYLGVPLFAERLHQLIATVLESIHLDSSFLDSKYCYKRDKQAA